ncbi:MAG: response regulator transcription factor [bacterium]
MKKMRILLADDHAIVRLGLKSLLSSEPDMEVVADVGDGGSAVRLARELLPDVVVMDITMTDLNGIDATHQIVSRNASVKVLCLSMHKQKQMICAALQSGALAYLVKNCAVRELAGAVRTGYSGKMYRSPEIAGEVMREFMREGDASEGGAFAVLSGREREVLQRIAQGRSTKEIGGDLHISEKTVATHRTAIMNKLHSNSVADLTRYAIREGLVEP